MMPVLVKGDDVRSGTKAKAGYSRHRSQWVELASGFEWFFGLFLSFVIGQFALVFTTLNLKALLTF